MDVYSESLNGKMKEIEEKIQKVIYIQEFEKAEDFEKLFSKTKENINEMREAESQTHLYYYQAMDALEAINFEIDDYMGKEGKTKEQELNRTIFLGKLKRFINDTKERNSQQMLADLKEMVQEVKKLEIEENLFSEMYSLTAKALLSTFMKQAQNKELIDLGLIEEVTTKEAFAKEIQNQLVAMAKEHKEDKVAAFDILKVCQEVNEQTIGDLKVWQTLSGDKEIKIKQPEPKKELPTEEAQEKQMISLEPTKRTIFDRLRDRFSRKNGSTIYTFGKFNEETEQYENIRIEQHQFPPKSKGFIKRCQRECIGLEINDVETVEINSIEANMPNLQSLSFGRNVREITRKDWEEMLSIGRNTMQITSLNKVEFSDSVEILGSGLFYRYENWGPDRGLTDIKFGENIREIGDACFYRCRLEDVELPNKLERIGRQAFSDCTKLKNVTFRENVQEIGDRCFDDCRNLETVNLPNELQKIGDQAFRGTKIKNVTLPEKLSVIGDRAFSLCENLHLQTIKLPENLSEIGSYVFSGCENLQTIKLPENLSKIGKCIFQSFKNNVDSAIHIPENIISQCTQAFPERSIFGN